MTTDTVMQPVLPHGLRVSMLCEEIQLANQTLRDLQARIASSEAELASVRKEYEEVEESLRAKWKNLASLLEGGR